MDILVMDYMSANPVTVEPEVTLPAAYMLMRFHEIRRLPVVDDAGQLVGIVTHGDIREARPKGASNSGSWELHMRAASLRVRDFMTTDPITVAPEDTVQRAAELMLDHKIGGLPVVEKGQVIGIITESDIFRLVVGSGILTKVPWDEAQKWGIEPHRELSPG